MSFQKNLIMFPNCFAEGCWLTCSDGLYMPLEIAFATCPNEIHIFRIAPLPLHYWLTLNDWQNSKSRMYNKDRFQNSEAGELELKPNVYEWKLQADKWLRQLYGFIPLDTVMYVRGQSQYNFFKYVCGYPNVKRIKLSTGRKILNSYHCHDQSRLLKYPCPGTEVATMAYYRTCFEPVQDYF